MKRILSLTKKPTFKYIYLIIILMMISIACTLSSGTDVVETTVTQEINTPEPVTETPLPTPTAEIELATVMPEPPTPWPEPGLPVLGSNESIPANGCIVYQNGQVTDEELPYVRSGPGMEFGVIGQLGRNRWANGLQMQDSWYEIIVGPGATGWVQESGIGDNGQCGVSIGQEVPIITNRGAPANSRCVAMRPGSSLEAPPVYQDANPESPLVARLGNWADVQQLLPSWYSILLPQGGIGWIEAINAELNIGCGTSGPIRIEFTTGTTATTIDGKLPEQAQVEYLFWAAEGQLLNINITSPENSILFHIEGVSNGQVIKHLLDGESVWHGTVPASQDYRLTLDNAGNVAAYTIHLSIN